MIEAAVIKRDWFCSTGLTSKSLKDSFAWDTGAIPNFSCFVEMTSKGKRHIKGHCLVSRR